jgi:hypothetical protein
MTKWTDWIEHDGSAECPVPDGVRYQWQFGNGLLNDSAEVHMPEQWRLDWSIVARYRTRLPGKKARIAELEAKLEQVSKAYDEEIKGINAILEPVANYDDGGEYVSTETLAASVVEKLAEARPYVSNAPSGR